MTLALVLGGSGYVAGELLRLLSGHPRIAAIHALSESQAGTHVSKVFPHLALGLDELRFQALSELEAIVAGTPRLAVFSAAPHGASAALVDRILNAAEKAGTDLKLVDLSADFRHADATRYQAIYGEPHGAPQRLAEFLCALPELGPVVPGRLVAHPGCFTTATVLAAAPLVEAGFLGEAISVVAITGSTGSGRTPSATTHHPERHANLYAYKPLAHRHAPEMAGLIEAAAGRAVKVSFVPQSGPFARGIYATVVAPLARPATREELLGALAARYAGSPFVSVSAEPPKLSEVVGTNRCRLSAAVDGGTAVVFSAIDNLVKGAAGGAVQWMNRMQGWPEATGLEQPGLGWI